MTYRGQGLRSNQSCQLCGNRTAAKRSVLGLPCPRCHRTVCVKHSVSLEGQTICVACLKLEPEEVRRQALRAVV